MQTAFEFYGFMPNTLDKGTLRDIGIWLENLPDNPGKKDDEALWSCHALTRAVREKWRLHEWSVKDGFFARKGCQHSWLFVGPTEKHPSLVLDVYPVASVGGPILVDTLSLGSAWRDLYIETEGVYFLPQKKKFEAEAAKILKLAGDC
jgi:hypothetical protein